MLKTHCKLLAAIFAYLNCLLHVNVCEAIPNTLNEMRIQKFCRLVYRSINERRASMTYALIMPKVWPTFPKNVACE